jgi:D-glycero-D-manno-heptose 1,7-bisphosphate phosphatase
MSESGKSQKVVILDRDGTLVTDRGYLSDPAGLQFESGAAEGLLWLFSRGYRLIVITNQSGVGRGLFPLERLHAMNARLHEMVQEAGARLEGVYCCPHAPDENCDCRKPGLALMRQAASELGFDPASAVVIGDKETDVEFGRRAGALTVLISLNPSPSSSTRPDIIAPNLMEAARAVTSLHLQEPGC